ncbi:MAG: bifunctional alpha,alpha-trehalose-phosphate synthase (UDP-forming)/trehalose-phosphatase [Candidatus Bipolaricaulaceae bacterium]
MNAVGKLIIVSNRLPVNIERAGGKLRATPSVGGLATGLGSFYQSQDSVWVGWPGVAADELSEPERATIATQLEQHSCRPVFLSRDELQSYYYGFCNTTIWPLFHYFPQYTEYHQDTWEAYKGVNAAFCQAVAECADPGDTIWVQDYHLLLLPGLIRERIPQAKIGFFLHIPFPSSELFRLLPWRNELMEHLLGADLIGFHTYDYVRHFLASVRRTLGYGQFPGGQLLVRAGSRVVKVDAYPMGIDYAHFERLAAQPEVQAEARRIGDQVGGRRVILSLDRLDYTKGLVERLQAYDHFLAAYPQYRGEVTLVLKAIASRTGVPQYQTLKEQLDELVGRINGKYGSLEWVPIWYLYRFLPERELVALYALADVALLTPVRDGMNLIAKEFLAAKADGRGVLILSEMAGAAKELPEALIVNPNNREEIAQAIHTALTMPPEEQRERNASLRKRLRRYHVVRWAQDYMSGLESVKRLQGKLAARKLAPRYQQQLVDAWPAARRRLLLLDYDGTLVPFADRPQASQPDQELLADLRALAAIDGTQVVIISGRDRDTLDRWLGPLRVGMVAEHGVWLRDSGEEWRTIEPLLAEWKDEIRPLLQLYVDRTPGSSVEEKDYSLVWHYRRVDEAFARVRVGELREDLAPFITGRNLEVVEGNRVLEVKNAGVNKGRAAAEWLSQGDWEFILAVGDDTTDEDTFAALPEGAYSVRVGVVPSQARFNLDSPRQVRELLSRLRRATT